VGAGPARESRRSLRQQQSKLSRAYSSTG